MIRRIQIWGIYQLGRLIGTITGKKSVLPCRHNIFELILRAVFDLEKLSPTKGPMVPLFKNFQNEWLNINQSQFATGMEDEDVRKVIHDKINKINLFVQN